MKEKAVLKRIHTQKDKVTGKRPPRKARATVAYVYRQFSKADPSDITFISGRAPSGCGAFTGDARLDALMLASRAEQGKNECGHFMLSAEEEMSSCELTAKLSRACVGFAERYLAGRGYLVVGHGRHAHIICEWYDEKGRAMEVPDALYKDDMKMLKFTYEFAPNPQTKIAQLTPAAAPGVAPEAARVRAPFDPKAKNTHAYAIAREIEAGKTTFAALEAAGRILPGRHDETTGKMTSFDFINAKGELVRIGVDNVEGRVEELRNKREVKAKAAALAELNVSARKMMSQGLGDLVGVAEEIVADPVPVKARDGRGTR